MIRRSTHFIRDIYDKRSILFELAKRDFQRQYMGSYLGVVWVYLQPLLFIGVLYLVFSVGLRSANNSDGAPFSVYLVTGMIAWYYLVENLNKTTAVIKEHSFLLKKVDFRLSMLPIVKLLSSSIPHLFFILIAVFLAALNGLYPTLYTLQLLYYFSAMAALLLGMGWLTSSTNLFVPDVSKVVGILVTFGFWLTPIFWNIAMVPEKYQWIIKLNPAYYVVQGYRDAVFRHVAFWERPYQTLYFWLFTAGTLWAGIIVFKKLRPHFAEVA